MERPGDVDLGNWRRAPRCRWSFHHVRELIPSANIRRDPASTCALQPVDAELEDLQLVLKDPGPGLPLLEVLTRSHTDAFLVLKDGAVAFEWYAPHYDGLEPHILFSVSKSLTGSLAGILVESDRLDVDKVVTAYVPDALGSGYDGCRVRDLLDMQVGLDFVEDYSGSDSQFHRYRVASGWNLARPGEPSTDLRAFLRSMRCSDTAHGTVFQYYSPNSDMLGLVLEAASGRRLWDLFSDHVWRPVGAESDAYVTVDRIGTPRAAGGICARPRDLARFGQMMCDGGRVKGRQVIPAAWVDDTLTRGSYDAWRRGDMCDLAPQGRYRNQWYQTGNGPFFAVGIHGQWIYADPVAKVVVVKLSSQPEPVDDAMDKISLALFDAVAAHLSAGVR